MKKHSKLTTLLIGVIVVLVAGLLWWLVLGSDKPTAKDYDQSQKASQALSTSYAQLEKDFNTYEADPSVANQAAYQKSYDLYQTDVAAMGSALDKLGDSALNDKYKAFKTVSDDFTGYTSGYVDDYATAQALSTADCVKSDKILSGTADTLLKEYDARVQACRADIATLKQSANAGLASYATAISQLQQNRRGALVTVQSKMKSGDAAGIQTALSGVLKFETPDLSKSLLDARQKAGVAKQLNDLNNALATKIVTAHKSAAK